MKMIASFVIQQYELNLIAGMIYYWSLRDYDVHLHWIIQNICRRYEIKSLVISVFEFAIIILLLLYQRLKFFVSKDCNLTFFWNEDSVLMIYFSVSNENTCLRSWW